MVLVLREAGEGRAGAARVGSQAGRQAGRRRGPAARGAGGSCSALRRPAFRPPRLRPGRGHPGAGGRRPALHGASACPRAQAAPHRGRRCALSRRNSKLCFFLASGYSAGSVLPTCTTLVAFSSTCTQAQAAAGAEGRRRRPAERACVGYCFALANPHAQRQQGGGGGRHGRSGGGGGSGSGVASRASAGAVHGGREGGGVS